MPKAAPRIVLFVLALIVGASAVRASGHCLYHRRLFHIELGTRPHAAAPWWWPFCPTDYFHWQQSRRLKFRPPLSGLCAQQKAPTKVEA
jgi:hypothetical protein